MTEGASPSGALSAFLNKHSQLLTIVFCRLDGRTRQSPYPFTQLLEPSKLGSEFLHRNRCFNPKHLLLSISNIYSRSRLHFFSFVLIHFQLKMNLKYYSKNFSEPYVFLDGFEEFQNNFFETMFHFPVSLVFIGFYLYKIYRKQTAHLISFLSFHIFTYSSIVTNIMCLFTRQFTKTPQELLSAFMVHFNSILLSNIFIQLFLVVFHVTDLYWKLFDVYLSRRNIVVILIVIMTFSRLSFTSGTIIISISETELRLDWLDTFLCFIDMILLLVLFIQWKFFGIHQKDAYTLINSVTIVCMLTIFQVITILKTFLKYNSDLPLSFDKFIYNVYYFPYLWIISVYICNFKTVQIWIQNQKKRTSVTVVVPESRVVVRPQRIDETVVSNLSVSELETVM
ncbi:hypothetical protein CRE_02336 [Caenorhabditis remanei]|uniref:Uncharacterized protein n=1 Tax=Caenorhabditis remanei TaxID=31234 RepID=E3MIJ2_CAERE|nr:hypothetical protein CRE_02336 [Caenorhabditis remanei]